MSTYCARTIVNTDLGPHFITVSLWKIVAHQDCFQSGFGGASHPSIFRRHECNCNGSQAASEKADINIEFRPNDNRYLIVHEFSGLDPEARDSEDLQTIRDFVSRRTEDNRTPSERLHAIW